MPLSTRCADYPHSDFQRIPKNISHTTFSTIKDLEQSHKYSNNPKQSLQSLKSHKFSNSLENVCELNFCVLQWQFAIFRYSTAL